MTIGFAIRLGWVWLWLLFHGANVATCERVWDMSPTSSLPAGKSYEQWYGSPMLLCEKTTPNRWVMYCTGPNC